VEGGGGGLTVIGVSRNRGGFVKCVAIQKRLGIPALDQFHNKKLSVCEFFFMALASFQKQKKFKNLSRNSFTVLQKQDVRVWTELNWLRTGSNRIW
jgi:hypothetical protein